MQKREPHNDRCVLIAVKRTQFINRNHSRFGNRVGPVARAA
jgi:hypothetical protein